MKERRKYITISIHLLFSPPFTFFSLPSLLFSLHSPFPTPSLPPSLCPSLLLLKLSLILHLMGEACLKEDTLMRVLVVGLKRELPLSPADALDIADKLVARAANAHTDGR